MLPLRIADATRTLAESQDQYHALMIKDEKIDGINHMTSLWEPTPRELTNLINGGSVALSIQGTGHPPVSVYVHPMSEREGYRPQQFIKQNQSALHPAPPVCENARAAASALIQLLQLDQAEGKAAIEKLCAAAIAWRTAESENTSAKPAPAEHDPCQYCGQGSVVTNSRGQLVCERCLGEQSR